MQAETTIPHRSQGDPNKKTARPFRLVYLSLPKFEAARLPSSLVTEIYPAHFAEYAESDDGAGLCG